MSYTPQQIPMPVKRLAYFFSANHRPFNNSCFPNSLKRGLVKPVCHQRQCLKHFTDKTGIRLCTSNSATSTLRMITGAITHCTVHQLHHVVHSLPIDKGSMHPFPPQYAHTHSHTHLMEIYIMRSQDRQEMAV